MEREGPQNEGSRKTPARTNVVRLGDWIGPRDELVPFARRKGYRVREESSESPVDSDRAAEERSEPDPTPDPPPSADDFWGERAAAIHDAVQAPADAVAAGAGPGGDSRTRPPRSAAATRQARHRARMARVACVTAAGLAGLAIALNLFATGANDGGGQRIPLASVLSSRVSRILTLGLSRIQPTATTTSRLSVGRGTRARRRESRARPAFEAVHYTARARDAASDSPATSSASRATPAVTNGADTQHASSPPPPTSNGSTSSSAASPTGESGALGPIQSPNG